jgi:crossover junction endodeoxyribonuclease RuvC
VIVIGIDPGLDGGLALLQPEGLTMSVMPVVAGGTKRYLDEQALVQWLSGWPTARVWIEAVGARPGQGVVSLFSFGTGWGLVRGICAGLGLPYQLVRPQEWQGEVLKGMPKGSEYLVASRLWPQAEWRATPRCTKPHSGLVDAALIAEYGQRKIGG